MRCLSGSEVRVSGGVRHRATEVAEFDTVPCVQEKLVDADVSVHDGAGM